jgi:guanyl-specific ribonuclease Sa
VPPDAEYVADQIPNAPVGPPVTIGNRPRPTFYIDGTQFVGGDPWLNRGGDLPTVDASGSPITYKEYDTHPYTPGVTRDGDRIVIGSDGSRYFTNDHYTTFTKF